MKILIVEDDLALQQAMAESFRLGGFAIEVADTIARAHHWIDVERFDALVLDLGLPDGDGYRVVRHLRQRHIPSPVLILTARDSVEDRIAGLDLGADDYLVKPVALQELHARLRALIRRSAGVVDPHLKLGELRWDLAGKRLFLADQPVALSGREWAVLEYLVLHQRRIVSKEQLIQSIAGLDQDLSANAIEAYVHRLRSKIEGSGVVIRTVRGLGYMLEKDTDATA